MLLIRFVDRNSFDENLLLLSKPKWKKKTSQCNAKQSEMEMTKHITRRSKYSKTEENFACRTMQTISLWVCDCVRCVQSSIEIYIVYVCAWSVSALFLSLGVCMCKDKHLRQGTREVFPSASLSAMRCAKLHCYCCYCYSLTKCFSFFFFSSFKQCSWLE